MEMKTETMTTDELKVVEKAHANALRILRKIALYLFGFFTVILFIPMEVLKLFTKRGSRHDVSGILFQDLGMTNVLLFIVLPICALLVLIYFMGAHKIKKDLKEKTKEIGIVKVKGIKELSAADQKDIFGISDHIIEVEKNPFDIMESYFLKAKQPELMHVKAYRVEVSKNAKIELKREAVSELP